MPSKDKTKRVRRIQAHIRNEKLVTTHYEILKVLGEGHFSIVFKARWRTNDQMVAIKAIDKQSESSKSEFLEREVSILKRVDHPNIVRLFDIIETEQYLYLVMEQVTGGELFKLLLQHSHLCEQDTQLVVRQSLKALAHLHSLGVVHRDLKPENILLVGESLDSGIKLTDFGLSKIRTGRDLLQTACGTPIYCSPEVLRQRGYAYTVDVWAVGVIAYVLLSGYPPFFDQNISVLFQKIMDAHVEFPDRYWSHISEEAKDFIRTLLVANESERPTALDALEHRWVCAMPDDADIVQFSLSLTRGVILARFRRAVYCVMFVRRLARMLRVTKAARASSGGPGVCEPGGVTA